jgi:hypothetical protein
MLWLPLHIGGVGWYNISKVQFRYLNTEGCALNEEGQ